MSAAPRPLSDADDAPCPPLLRFVRRLASSASLAAEPDGELCARYALARDEAAFAELVRRHGGMVLGVCRRTLGHAADAEDAAQAVFLLLALRARRFAGQPTVGDWLHGVATRTALKARSKRARRSAVEAAAARPDAVQPPEADDAADAVDRAVRALPARLRQAVVLCELEGHPRAEVAARLGIRPGTLASRLAAARVKMRRRLGPLAPAILVAASASELPARAAFHLSQAALGTVPAAVSVLATEVLRVMTIAKLKTILAATLVAGGVAASGVAVSRSATAEGPQVAQEKPAAEKEKPPAEQKMPDAAKEQPSDKSNREIEFSDADGKVQKFTVILSDNQLTYTMPSKRELLLTHERSRFVGQWKVTSATAGDKFTDPTAEGIPYEFKFGIVRLDFYSQFDRQPVTVSARERSFARGKFSKDEVLNTAVNPYRSPRELTFVTGEPGAAKLLPYIYEFTAPDKLRIATFQAVGEVDRPRGFKQAEQPPGSPPLLILELERVHEPARVLGIDLDGNVNFSK